jgi:transcriptional regulator with XRE-family HTH domain
MDMTTRSPTEIDKAIGRNVRIARRASKLSQSKLAEHIGVTYQQVQKYENGTDRVGAARIYQIASLTDHPVGFFFDFTDEGLAVNQTSRMDVLADDDMQRLIKALAKIKSPKLLKNLGDIANTFAENPNGFEAA